VTILAAALLGVGGLAALVVGPAAHAGPDSGGGGPDYPRGAAVTGFRGLAFDTCQAPPVATMQAWRDSPYRALGIYLSGVNRSCQQRELTTSWVERVSAAGWRLLPIDGGLQAPCRDNTRKKAINTRHARSEGVEEAVRSVRAAAGLGIRPGSAIYADIESYHGDADCVRAVAEYLSGWTSELHRRGYLSGMYGNLGTVIADAAARYSSPHYLRTDAVWVARWDGSARLTGWRGVDDNRWPGHQRAKQYRGDHLENHGGVTLNIDSDSLDAPVATIAAPLRVTGRHALARPRPDPASVQAADLSPGSTVHAVCRTQSRDSTWAALTTGSWVDDAELAPGSVAVLPDCTYPGSVTAPVAAVTRIGPGPNTRAASTLQPGELAWVDCHDPQRPDWLRLPDRTWIDAHDLSFAGHTPDALPPCGYDATDAVTLPAATPTPS